jgi:hypothetical protein
VKNINLKIIYGRIILRIELVEQQTTVWRLSTVYYLFFPRFVLAKIKVSNRTPTFHKFFLNMPSKHPTFIQPPHKTISATSQRQGKQKTDERAVTNNPS